MTKRALMGYWLHGHPVNKWHYKIAQAVACPRCRSNVGWPCTTASGKRSSTAHAARNEIYQEKVAQNAK